jgi:hypothetical protein
MGNEILYCCQCHNQIRTSDFDRGIAFRIEDKGCCAACAPIMLANLPPEERIRFFKKLPALQAAKLDRPDLRTASPRSPSVRSPRSRTAAPVPNKIRWILGGAAGSTVLVTVAVLALWPSPEPPATPPLTKGGRGSPGSELPLSPEESKAQEKAELERKHQAELELEKARISKAAQLLNEALEFRKKNPTDQRAITRPRRERRRSGFGRPCPPRRMPLPEPILGAQERQA